MKKLKDLLNEIAFESEQTVNKHEVIENVKNYSSIGESLMTNNSIMEVAEQLAQIAESAHSHVLSETDDWFDKVTVNKNMKSLKGSVVEFQKTAREAHSTNQRLTALYEDIGHVLNRYYDINEGLDPLGKEDGDVDNDGDSDEADSYLKNKRKVATKAIKNERAGAGGVVTLKPVGGLGRKHR